MTLKKSALILSFLSVAGWLVYHYYFATTTTAVTSRVVTVQTGSIRSSVKSTGKIFPIQTTTLSFSKQGTVSKIFKKVGDAVKAGDVIAEINAESAHLDIDNAKIALANAKNNYDKLFANTTESDKIRAKNTLSESQTTLKLLESQYDNLLVTQKNDSDQAQANIKLLQDKLALAKSDLEYTQKNVLISNTSTNLEKDVANGYLSLEEVNRTIPAILKDFKDLLYIDDKSNSRYGDLSARDLTLKSQAEALYTTLRGNADSFTGNLASLRNKSVKTYSDVLTLLQSSQGLLSDMGNLSSLIVSEYDASIESINLAGSFITDAKTTLRSDGSTLSTKLSTINSTIANLKTYGNEDLQALSNKNTVTQKEQAVTSATNDLAKATASYDTLKSSQESERSTKIQDITKQKNAIALNQASYDEMVRGPIGVDITSAKNSIAQSQISLEKANLALKDYQIVATFDGVITDIPWITGDTTLSTEGISIDNKNMYAIELSLDQIDIVKVKPGMPAKIVLDAFPKETYTGVVESISAVPTVTSGVVSYTAKIVLSITRSDVYSQMSATAEIIISEKNDIILVNSSATTSFGGKSYIKIQSDNGTTERREVTLGLTDNGKVEVLSGLSVGEKILITTGSGKTSTSGTRSSTSSSTRTNNGGGFGGPPLGL